MSELSPDLLLQLHNHHPRHLRGEEEVWADGDQSEDGYGVTSWETEAIRATLTLQVCILSGQIETPRVHLCLLIRRK